MTLEKAINGIKYNLEQLQKGRSHINPKFFDSEEDLLSYQSKYKELNLFVLHFLKLVKGTPQFQFDCTTDDLRKLAGVNTERPVNQQEILSLFREGLAYVPKLELPYPAFWLNINLKAKTNTREAGALVVSGIEPDQIDIFPFWREPKNSNSLTFLGRSLEVCAGESENFVNVRSDPDLDRDINKWKKLFMSSYCVWSAVNLFFKFLECRNVTIEDVKVNRPKKSKVPTKKNKKEWIIYKVLEIKSSKNTQGGMIGGPMGESKNKVHLCRGHFKTYTKERPLMGRHTGTYYWGPSVKGTKTEGIVIKDYEVEVK